MIVEKTIKLKKRSGLKILIISGVHGDESHAVAATYELYKNMNKENISDKVAQITYIFNLNEYGLEENNRTNDYEKEDSNDCNRLFPNEYKTAQEIKEYIEKLDTKYDLVLDVHNSWTCVPCALIDYNTDAIRLLRYLRGTEIYPMVRVTNIGTLKKHFNKLGSYAYTIELPELGSKGNIQESKRLLEQFIKTFVENISNDDTQIVELSQDVLSQEICTFIENGVIKYNRTNFLGNYRKDDIIATVENMNDGSIEFIKAPFDGVLYCIVDNIYAHNGKYIGNYGKDLRHAFPLCTIGHIIKD